MIVEDEGFLRRWAHRLFGPHHAEPPPPPTREELLEALTNCDRQLEILHSGPIDTQHRNPDPRAANFQPEIAELEAVRTALAQALADMGPETPPAP